jgi:hypothetical protein
MVITKRHPILVIFLLVLSIFLLVLILKNNIVSFPDLEYSGVNSGKTSQVYEPNSNIETGSDSQPSNSNPPSNTSNSPTTQLYIPKKTSLTVEEVSKVRNAILSSEFIGALPDNGIISLQFFNFENGQRIWLNKFLIGKNQILTSGTPEIFITLHYKYIEGLTATNLCETIQTANTNGDLGAWSDLSDTRLALKYSSVIKYRSCFGI